MVGDPAWPFLSAFESMLDRIKEAYGRALRVALRNKKWVLVSILAMLIGAFALVPAGFIGTAFVSPSDKGELNIALEMAPKQPQGLNEPR